MKLFAKTEKEYFLKEIGGRLVNTGMHEPNEILENEKEREFYLDFQNPEISIPILEGYGEKAEEQAFSKDARFGDQYRRAGFAKEAVRTLSLIRKIAFLRSITESKGKKDLISKIDKEIISIGDKANKFRPEYVFERGIDIDFSAVPFAYNHADGTTERRLETAEKIIENQDFIPNLLENMFALYSKIGTKYAQRIARKLSEQYLKPIGAFDSESNYDESIERVLKITKELYGERAGLFQSMEEFLDKELLARIKYPNSKITKLEGKVIVIPKGEEKIIVIDDKEKEIATKSA